MSSTTAMPNWFYMSFSDERRFLGGCYVQADGFTEALTRSHALGINPGGEVKAVGPIDGHLVDEYVSEADRERLLRLEELGEAVSWN